MPADADLMTVAESAKVAGCSVATVHRRIASGDLTPARKLPGLRGAYLLRRSDVLALVGGAAPA